MTLIIAMVCVVLAAGFAAGSSAFQLYCTRQFDLDFARLLADSTHWAEAEQVLRHRVDDTPTDAKARMLLGRVFAGKNELDKSVAALAAVHESSVLKGEALLREGQTHLMRNDAVRAEAALRRAIEHADTPAEFREQALRELVELYSIEDRESELETVLWQLVEMAVPSDRAAIMQKIAFRRVVRIEPRVRITRLEEFLEANPRDRQAGIGLGRALVEQSQSDQAVAILEPLIESDRTDVGAWRAYLSAVYQKGDLKTLASRLGEAPHMLEDESGYWKLKAVVAQDRQDWKSAAELLQRAIALSPHEPDLHGQLAVALNRVGQTALGKQHAQSAKTIRDLREQLQTGYQEWHVATTQNAPPPVKRQIAQRVHDVLVALGAAREAESWSTALGLDGDLSN